MKTKILLVFLIMFSLSNNTSGNENINLYDFSFEDIDGNQVNLDKFTGKPILVVNTASRCGYTPQYANLQNLFLEYKDSDLTIIATTSNSFYQEYDEVEDIKKICLVNSKILSLYFLNGRLLCPGSSAIIICLGDLLYRISLKSQLESPKP